MLIGDNKSSFRHWQILNKAFSEIIYKSQLLYCFHLKRPKIDELFDRYLILITSTTIAIIKKTFSNDLTYTILSPKQLAFKLDFNFFGAQKKQLETENILI